MDGSPAPLAVSGPHRAGRLVERGADPAAGKQLRHGSPTVAAIPGLPLLAVDPCTLPAMPPSPRAGHPLNERQVLPPRAKPLKAKTLILEMDDL